MVDRGWRVTANGHGFLSLWGKEMMGMVMGQLQKDHSGKQNVPRLSRSVTHVISGVAFQEPRLHTLSVLELPAFSPFPQADCDLRVAWLLWYPRDGEPAGHTDHFFSKPSRSSKTRRI